MASNLLFSLLAPSRAVMRRLALRYKLGLVALLALLPLALVAWITLAKVNDDLAFTRDELHGIAGVQATLELLGRVEAHRHHAHLASVGDAPSVGALASARTALGPAIERVERALDPALLPAFKPTQEALRALTTLPIATSDAAQGERAFERHAAPVAALRMLVLDAAERSGLLLDPESTAYFLMDLAIERHAPWADALTSARTLGMGLLARGEAKGPGRIEVIDSVRRVEERLALVARSAGAVTRSGAEPPAAIDQARRASERFVRTAHAAFGADAGVDAGTAWLSAGDEAVATLEPAVLAALATLEARLTVRAAGHERQRLIVIGVSALTLLVLAFLLAGLYTATVGTMGFMHRAVAETASGNLVPSAAIRGTDEFARTGEQLERMNAELSVLIAGVRSNAVLVSNIGASLAQGNAELSSQAEQQATSLQATTQGLHVINETAARTAESVRSVDAHAADMQQTAEAGGAAMREAVEAIRAVEDSASKIRDIIDLINGIAFQTNILALNAAVEAARAGEHGRGFAVVATEVRTLAQRCATAAGEIQGLVQRTSASVALCSDRIGTVSGRLDAIVKGTRGLAENTRTISAAANEESESLRRISVTMGELDELTQRTSQMADSAREASIDLQHRASHLNRALGIFKLRQGAADEAIAMVDRALPAAARGTPAGLSRITGDATLRDRDMYVFVFDRAGVYRAVAGNPARVGVALSTIPGLDARKLVDDAFRAAERGGGWVDYRIDNPATGRTEPKTSYVVPLADGLVLGCGIYRTEFADA